MPRNTESLPIAIVGAGAVGTVLGRRLNDAGYPIAAVISATRASANELAQQLGAPVASAETRDIPNHARIILCCVPDDALPAVTETLRHVDLEWAQCVLAHTSGSRTAAVFDPLAGRGAAVLSFHPVQTFTRKASPDLFANLPIGIEGNTAGEAAGVSLAKAIGAHPIRISREAKVRYHLAASIASNFLVTLTAIAHEVLGTIPMEDADRRALLHPLTAQSLRAVVQTSPGEALTGPIVRGDIGTVSEHQRALERHLPHLVSFYRTMALHTLNLAREQGRLDDERARALAATLGAKMD